MLFILTLHTAVIIFGVIIFFKNKIWILQKNSVESYK